MNKVNFVLSEIYKIVGDNTILYDFESSILKEALQYVVYNNKSNTLPYHSLKHTFSKIIKSSNIYKSIVINNKLLSYPYTNYSVPIDQILTARINLYKSHDDVSLFILILSDLFHDFNHSGGKLTDSENIKNAIEGFTAFMQDKKCFFSEYDFYNVVYEAVTKIIKSTEYPYTVDQNELSLASKISRDTDLLEAFSDDSFTHAVCGLSKELNINLKEFITKQMNFINNMTFNTDEAREIYNRNKTNLLQLLQSLVK